MTVPLHLRRTLLGLSLVLALGACGGGGDGGLGGTGGSIGGGGGGGGIGGTGGTLGTMKLSLTDAPGCGVEAVKVTIAKVRVNQNPNAQGDDDGGWLDILPPGGVPQQFDLLQLTDGKKAPLGQLDLPPGKYTRLRLVLVENGANGASPLANSVVPTGGVETPLDTPSADQSGLKVSIDADVALSATTELLIDFDACRSIVAKGNSGRYGLKPQITATVVR